MVGGPAGAGAAPSSVRAGRRRAGRVLAADVVAAVSLPSFDNSAMDGYAVRAAELAGADRGAPVELPVAADIPAGRTDVPPLRARHRAPDHDRRAAARRAPTRCCPVEQTDGGTERVRLRGRPTRRRVRAPRRGGRRAPATSC